MLLEWLLKLVDELDPHFKMDVVLLPNLEDHPLYCRPGGFLSDLFNRFLWLSRLFSFLRSWP